MRNLRFHRMVIGLVLLLTIDMGSAAAGRNRFHRRRCFLPGPYYEAAQTPVAGPAASPASPGARPVVPRMPLAAETPSGQLPFVADKPEPRSTTYTVLLPNGETASCGPRGDDQGDQDLNFLKNRVDQPGMWIQVDFDAVLNQAYPEAVGKHDRANWSENDMAAVKRYEGLPISIECYIAWANDEGKESCNCHIDDQAMFDIHIWLTKEPATIEGSKAPDRRRAVVAEVTPRLKPDHPQWTQNTLRRLAKEGKKVRVSGWLLLDQEHPEQLKATATHSQTRGTLWEIHPIIEIEVWDNDQWVPLDNLQVMAGPIADRKAA